MALCFKTQSSPESSRCSLSKQDKIKNDFLHPKLKGDGSEYLQKVKAVAVRHSRSEIELRHGGRKVTLKVGTLEETSYNDEAGMLEEWEQFYLPVNRKMEVIGVLEEFPCTYPSDDLVLMVCEDGKVFAYEDNQLHLVSDSLKDLFEAGLKFPGTEQYYRGQRFEHMTEKDWDKVRKSKEVKKMMEEHQEMLKEMKPSYLKNLDILMGRKSAVACKPNRTAAAEFRAPVVLKDKLMGSVEFS